MAKTAGSKNVASPTYWILIIAQIIFGVCIILAVLVLAMQIHVLTVQVNRALMNGNNSVSNCVEAAGRTRHSGVYDILVPDYDLMPFKVACNEDLDGGGWTVILRRVDGSVDFYRDWTDYKRGFGNLYNEFWIGLDKLHTLTSGRNQELLITLESEKNGTRYARYEHFTIADEAEDYALIELGAYSGDAGDALSYHLGQKFTTKDHKNNLAVENCAVTFGGAWWFRYCRKSHLNGRYYASNSEKGIEWTTIPGNLKGAQMMIRPIRKLL